MKSEQTNANNSIPDTFIAGLLALAPVMVPQVLAGLNDETTLEAWAEAETREGVRAAILRKLKTGPGSLSKIPTLVAFARVAEVVQEKGMVAAMQDLSKVIDEKMRPPRSGSSFTETEVAEARFKFGDTRKCTNPECNHEGDLMEDFGLRRMRGPGSPVRPQSHCFKCRNKARPRGEQSHRKVRATAPRSETKNRRVAKAG